VQSLSSGAEVRRSADVFPPTQRMTRSADDNLPWPPRPPGRHPEKPSELLSPSTQIVRDREDYLGQGIKDIGRRIADDQVELFVSADPASALQQQLERLAPEYIALHDIGTSATLRLLGALAGAAGARVQRLSIRRQGHGVALAVVQFIEIQLAGGELLRIYSTDVNADATSRQQIAQVLLARARLGVLMVGELPPHALTSALQPLRDAIQRGHWPNRDLLMLPLGSATTLAAQGSQLVGHSGVVVRVTPQAARPNDAWSFISGTWNRLRSGGDDASLNTDIARAVPRPQVPRPEAPTQPMPFAAAPVATPPSPWAEYASRCAAVKGVVSCCVFELASQRVLAHTGGTPADRLAAQGAALIDTMASAAHALGLGRGMPEAAVTVGQQHLLLKAVPGHAGVVLHLVLQASASNLTLARMQLERVTAPQ
jgi:hypothetical protein